MEAAASFTAFIWSQSERKQMEACKSLEHHNNDQVSCNPLREARLLLFLALDSHRSDCSLFSLLRRQSGTRLPNIQLIKSLDGETRRTITNVDILHPVYGSNPGSMLTL